ncbi:GMP synthase-like glutamine amidotransferase [Hypnocyclicus thermotrophus]|uniref:GMP synthase-like glutamine amidotransferase n=1 Tax=Hypnocyclicus thermotrophus TaxID=1627895 RepID=A0AA46E030_9FUSO|nr:type 1 glutamine amidotransferase [Hypnocyclicus thermotrophus]TDT71871.1 GMP synthase-like glutamine amidotransferase [Hypnocyclicus thermotrophus]
MNIFCIKHVSFEDPGIIENWAIKNNYTFKYIKMYENYKLPNINDIDILVILGGPMNIYEEKQYPFLKEEKTFIKQVINANKKIIGICLGAQLIADLLGSKVVKNKEKEIGWFNVKKVSNHKFLYNVPTEFKTMHWHGDKFLIPDKAEKIFESEACDNQGFIFNNIIALQFHLEMKKENIISIIDNSNDELTENKNYIQSKNQILNQLENIEINNKIMQTILENFIK